MHDALSLVFHFEFQPIENGLRRNITQVTHMQLLNRVFSPSLFVRQEGRSGVSLEAFSGWEMGKEEGFT